jgi:hypothetical protein
MVVINADGKGEGNMNIVDENTSPDITNTNTNMDVLLMGSWSVSILKTEEAVGPILILFRIKIKIVFSYHIRIILTPSIQSVELIQKNSSSVSRLQDRQFHEHVFLFRHNPDEI